MILFSLSISTLGLIFPMRLLPNLLFLYVVVLACLNEPGYYFVAIISSLFLDFSTGVYPGSYLFAFIIMVLLIRLVFDKIIFSEKQAKYLVFIVIIGSYFLPTWIYLYNSFFVWLRVAYSTTIDISFGLDAFYKLLFNLAFLYPVYLLNQLVLSLLEKFKQNRRLV